MRIPLDGCLALAVRCLAGFVITALIVEEFHGPPSVRRKTYSFAACLGQESAIVPS